MNTLTLKQFTEKFGANDNAVVINVLASEMYRNEHIPGSVNVPLDSLDFEGEVDKIADKTDTIVTYCASAQCPAAETAARHLEEAGYKNVSVLKGGIAEWKDAGKPTDSDIPAGTPRDEAARTGGEVSGG